MASVARQNDQPLLSPPQFGLRSLLAGMAIVSGLFAVMSALGLAWSLLLAFILLLVAGHVCGNAVGTKLRDRAGMAAECAPPAAAPPGIQATQLGETIKIASDHRLSTHARLTYAAFACGVVGAVGAGALGYVIAPAVSPHVTIGGIALACGSAAVLGGLAGFLLSSFFCIARHALGEALAAQSSAGPARASSDPARARV